ncbi:hypothetical protein M0813_29193 [Anaeramoeba flamelloides]|uniref:Uncharacterized protein n=1 Tax=Anaeramoeba flamelloides TaxID=1746091 RepID=A0ABQ8XPX8_9EUKA|nr:hypothetical protein M0813_29193 [Anaeramoeba flamelloides]
MFSIKKLKANTLVFVLISLFFIQISGITLEEAVDNQDLTFTSGGDKNWFGQDEDSYYGGDAARSGNITDGQVTWMETTVNGNGSVSFYWKTSSEYYDFLTFYIDGEETNEISGQNMSWVKFSHEIRTEGEHTLKWVYTKDVSYAYGEDCVWVDKVVFDPKKVNPDTGINLQEAVDNDDLIFATGGDIGWYGQNEDSYYGGDAARSGNGLSEDGEQSWMGTTVSGDGTVSFYWKTSSESASDYLTFYFDGEEIDEISGLGNWAESSYDFTGYGNHTMRWVYTKEESDGKGEDCGYVDKIKVSKKIEDKSIPLDEALDNLDLFIITGGDQNWYGQNATYMNDHNAAKSGDIDDDGESWMETTVDGNGTVSFYWKVSSEGSFDFLEFYLDGELIDQISGKQDWNQFNYTIYSDGEHTLRWVYTKDESDTSRYDCGWVDKLIFDKNHFAPNENVPLGTALDNPDLTFTTYGDSNWFGQNEDSYYGGDAARSGEITNGSESWMETWVRGPGRVSFYWKVSSESDYDFLSFYDDDEDIDEISGEQDWIQFSYEVGYGYHNLRWAYTKDGSDREGEDCGWVDKLVFEKTEPKNVSLEEAVDNDDLTFTTGGDSNWFGQDEDSYYGGDAARSGGLLGEQESWMETTVNGMGTVSFYWKVSSEYDWDFLTFYIDGKPMDQISGWNISWAKASYGIGFGGEHTLKWVYTKDEYDREGEDCGWVDKVLFEKNNDTVIIPLAEALDNLNLTFTTGGDGITDWFGQNETSYYGGDAAISGYIGGYEKTWMETKVEGTGEVSFYWKVSSEYEFDFLIFYIDGEVIEKISGFEDWSEYKYKILDDGEHTLKWVYTKDEFDADGDDCGWVDKVVFKKDTASLANNIFPYTLTFIFLLFFLLF